MLQLIIFAPLLGSVFSGFFYRRFNENVVLSLTTFLIFLSCLGSWITFFSLDFNSVEQIILIKWMESGSLVVNWEVRLDSLTTIMLVVITTISAFVHLYSFGYMGHDPNWEDFEKYKPRFFSYLSLFTFAMLMLVTSNNFVQLFFGWEGVGLASYLLIGFYYKKSTANIAAIKAFIVNRIGDIGLALAIFCTFYYVRSLDFDDLFVMAPDIADKTIEVLFFKFNALEFIVILFFLGAMGKSAQFFLHTWLPDAMEGPTPVSALIHAATMVTAGVFLLCRLSPAIEFTSLASNLIVLVGVLTAFFAGTVALVQNDVKKIIAYSTCSQLGFMFSAAGIGLYQAAMFHLFTHAFFKALLFLCAGSIIHSMHHQQDIRTYGGLRRKLPITFYSMMIGTFAITGVGIPLSYDLFNLPLGFSGFVSKDSIIEGIYASNNHNTFVYFLFIIFSAFLTSLYSWRLIILTFFGEYRGKRKYFDNAEENSKSINITLIILSICSIFVGVIFYDFFLGKKAEYFFSQSIYVLPTNTILSDLHYIPVWAKLTPFLSMIVGLFLAFIFYIHKPNLPQVFSKNQNILYNFLLNKWYFDEIYNAIFVKSSRWLGHIFWKIGDEKIIDGFINFISLIFIPTLTKFVGRIQTGFIYHYAFAIFIGLVSILTYFLVSIGG
ncbi:MAG: NADH-quinone oxidoreductase subunit L [Paracoccaceae bacterium]